MDRSMILLVSTQPMPNLLSALDPTLNVTEAHLIVSSAMETGGQAAALTKVLTDSGISVQRHTLGDTLHPEETRRCVASLLANRPSRFIVNLTGGTKMMSLGAYKAALDAKVGDILYIDHEKSQLHWLDSNRPPQPCTARATIAQILAAHGLTIKKQEDAPSAPACTLASLLHAQLQPPVLGTWNVLFKHVEDRYGKKWRPVPINVQEFLDNNSSRLTDEWRATLHSALHTAAEQGFCHYSDDKLTVDRRDQKQFLGGGWFEIIVWQTLTDVKDTLNLAEVKLNVTIESGGGTDNEFDIIARTTDNRLILLEVKTATMGGAYGKPVEHFYKLDSQKPKAGLTAEACLVSRVEVSAPEVRERFKRNRIGLIDGEKTAPGTFATALTDWF